MSSVVDTVVEVGTLGLVDDFSGTEAAQKDAEKAQAAATQAQTQAAQQAIKEQRRASAEGQAFLAPFGVVGQQGLDQASFLTDPQQQYDFLQSNPLFQNMLDNANRATLASQAARGKLGSGSTLERLSQNAMLQAMPLIADQKQSIAGLLDFGRGLATAQGNVAIGQGSNVSNLLTQIGNAQSAGLVGGFNTQQAIRQGNDQLFGGLLGAGAGALISDIRLKENIKYKGDYNNHKWYSWTWNEKAEDMGLKGNAEGVIAQEVEKIQPEAIVRDGEYLKVNYSMLGA